MPAATQEPTGESRIPRKPGRAALFPGKPALRGPGDRRRDVCLPSQPDLAGLVGSAPSEPLKPLPPRGLCSLGMRSPESHAEGAVTSRSVDSRPCEDWPVCAFTDDSAAAREQRGNDAAVRAAVLTVAALSAIEPAAQETRDQPTVVICRILRRLLGYVKTVFPDDEKVQAASLDFKRDEDAPGYALIDSELFFDEYIRLPFFKPLPEDVSPGLVYLDNIIVRGYSCVRQATVGATDALGLGDLPSDEEFRELVLFFAPDDLSDLVPALSWAFNSDVHFGVESDGTFPAVSHLNVLESVPAKLVSRANEPSQNGTRVGRLKQRLAHELALMVSVLQTGQALFENVDQVASYDREESILAEGINQALIPVTRVIAAEHLSYIRNRMARRASRQDAALSNYTEACRLAHFAFNVGGRARYAKYIAQNLLEIATATRDGSRRILAEMIWIDAYAVPYVLGLTSYGNTPFTDLGWTSAVYAPPDIAIDYSTIPPYSVQPNFVYSGSIAERLRQIFPSFPPDLWTAAVLLAQHLKDLGGPYQVLEPDKQLALFVPADDAKERFPMREQHPVAWLYLLSDMLLREHRSLRHPHAGLHFAPTADHWYRRWLGAELQGTFRRPPSEGTPASRTRRFPHVAKYLLEPIGTAQQETHARPTAWSTVAAKWAV
jgi:hypothetical protein